MSSNGPPLSDLANGTHVESTTIDDSSPIHIDNYMDGRWIPSTSGTYLPVHNPATGQLLAEVTGSVASDVQQAVQAAQRAAPAWQRQTLKSRAAALHRLYALIVRHTDELAATIVQENGKNVTEALAEVAKALETVEYASSLPSVASGQVQRVSSTVTCQDRRDPLGLVVCIVPFNFPLMVPCWTFPIALALGNVVLMKPSEKVPMTLHKLAQFMHQEHIFPPGVFQLVHGAREAAQALMTHDAIQAVTFVGSSPVAQIVSQTCRAKNIRCTALGGAKNHLVALPDCHIPTAARDIVVSFAGCAGQRCMAASVLLLVRPSPWTPPLEDPLLATVVDLARQLKPGQGPGQMGPVIDRASYQKIISYIELAEQDGAQVLLDGRTLWSPTDLPRANNGGAAPDGPDGGHWIGPTILLHASPADKTMQEEVFGPVLSVFICDSWQQAVEIEKANPFGNAAAIYTSSGSHAEWFTQRFRAAMLGVNVGIPVPREPFSFGGLYGTKSKYGDMDITGDGAVEFFTHRIKITSQWPEPSEPEEQKETPAPKRTKISAQPSESSSTIHDPAHFSGRM